MYMEYEQCHAAAETSLEVNSAVVVMLESMQDGSLVGMMTANAMLDEVRDEHTDNLRACL